MASRINNVNTLNTDSLNANTDLDRGYHILYFSSHCEYSMQIYSTIADALNVRDHFYPVCVDDLRGEIPGFVTCVPTILTSDRRLLVDYAVSDFVNQVIHASRPSMTGPDGAGLDAGNNMNSATTEGVRDWGGFGCKHAFSDGYAVFDTFGGLHSGDDHHSFELLQPAEEVAAVSPAPPMVNGTLTRGGAPEINSRRPSKIDPKEMEQFMQNRDRDTTEFAKRQLGHGPNVQNALPIAAFTR